ncbi:AI-2E family transporter [soil metagenome]
MLEETDRSATGDNAAQPDRLHLHMPIDVRSASLAVLAVLAGLFALKWASDVLIPLALGLIFSVALSPLVNRLERWRLPRALGAAVVMVSLLAGVGWTAYSLSADASALIESLPAATQKVRRAVQEARRHQSGKSAIDQVQSAAKQLEQAAAAGGTTESEGVTRVRIERSPFDIKDYLWTGTLGLMASAGKALVVLFITFFLLASGDTFRRKLVRIAGPTFARRRITVQALDEITQQVERYLLVQMFTSALVGLVTGLSFWAIGIEHAAVWGLLAFALDFIPYLGALTMATTSSVVAFLQFGSMDMAIGVAGLIVFIHVISGQLLTPWLNSRASRMNAVAVFVGVLAFGWLWGIWGLLLGVPVLTTVKAICDRVDDLNPIGELLGS